MRLRLFFAFSLLFRANALVLYNIGFTNDGSEYKVITDFDFWEQSLSIDFFLEKLSKENTLSSVLDTAKRNGYEILEDKNVEDNSTQLILTQC